MGKYYDDYEREADYQSWVYYRESSHEERESKKHYIRSDEAAKPSKSNPVIQQIEFPKTDVFRDFPEHKARIVEAEQKYFDSVLETQRQGKAGNES